MAPRGPPLRSVGRDTVLSMSPPKEGSPEGMRGWVKQDRTDRGEGHPGALTGVEREELTRLRRQTVEQLDSSAFMDLAWWFTQGRASFCWEAVPASTCGFPGVPA